MEIKERRAILEGYQAVEVEGKNKEDRDLNDTR